MRGAEENSSPPVASLLQGFLRTVYVLFTQSCKHLTLLSHSPLLSNKPRKREREESKKDREKRIKQERARNREREREHYSWPHLFYYPAGLPLSAQRTESWDLDRWSQLGLMNFSESQRPQDMLSIHHNTIRTTFREYLHIFPHPGFN